MVKPSYSDARRHLMKCDPKLRDVIKRIGPCQLHSVAPKDPFEALCMSIASQQLSIKAAATIYGRFADLFPKRKPTPNRVMTLTHASGREETAPDGRGLEAVSLGGLLVPLAESDEIGLGSWVLGR